MLAFILSLISLAFSLTAGVLLILIISKNMHGVDTVKHYERKIRRLKEDRDERELKLVDFMIDACESGDYCGNCIYYDKDRVPGTVCEHSCRRGMYLYFKERENSKKNGSLLYANVPIKVPLTARQADEEIEKMQKDKNNV